MGGGYYHVYRKKYIYIYIYVYIYTYIIYIHLYIIAIRTLITLDVALSPCLPLLHHAPLGPKPGATAGASEAELSDALRFAKRLIGARHRFVLLEKGRHER